MKIGVLAVQGAFIEHIQMLRQFGVKAVELRKKEDLGQQLDGLILPGGESTAMAKLLHELGMFLPLKKRILEGLPVFGTCAGMILLAKELEGDCAVHFGTMDICAVRNAYGRQLGSFCTKSQFAGQNELEMPFIRAPYIREAGGNVQILSVVEDKIVAARQGNQLVTAFHPELTADGRVHQYFLEMIQRAKVGIS
jgi:5'-phosphate synthase pdxT subunit